MNEMRLHGPAGNRLYLNGEERASFLAVARRQPARDRTLCEGLHWTGCRPSEALEITPDLPPGGPPFITRVLGVHTDFSVTVLSKPQDGNPKHRVNQ
jgi:hypothetical protein